MMTNRLAEHVKDPMSEERLERIWQEVDARRDEYQPSPRRVRLVAYASSLAVAAGVLIGLYWGLSAASEDGPAEVAHLSEDSVRWEAGAALRTAGEKMSVDLEDGSKVTLSPRSRVAMEDTESADVELKLQEGRVACQVAKSKGRTFSVVAGEVVVRVVGTTFSVERSALDSGEKVTVEVREGIVEVEGPDGVQKRLAAGESWSVKIAGEPQAEPALAPADDTNDTARNPSRSSGSSVDRPKTKRDLFAEARAKRNAGDAAGAAVLYQTFLTKHSADARAGVAALELGRLKMDQLGDVAGAIAPLQQAASSGAGGLGDDALARLARAYSSLGQASACKSAKARYLKAYPNGVHVGRVRSLCP